MLHLLGICANFSHGQTVLMLMLVSLYKSHDSTDITSSRTLPSYIGSRFLLLMLFLLSSFAFLI